MDNFCPLPWLHLASDTDGGVRYCCRSTNIKKGTSLFNLGEDSVKSVWNSDSLKAIRKQFLNNQQPAPCSACFDEERMGKLSKRLIEKQNWPDIQRLVDQTDEDGYLNSPPASYDLRLGNVCNLKCRMCNANNSTAIQSEYLQLNSRDRTLFPLSFTSHDWWKKEFMAHVRANSKTLRRLAFAGGEPSLSKEFIELLEFLKEKDLASEIRLEVTTNLTHLSDRLLTALSGFKRVQINCSLDGFKEINNYIRYPSDWEMIRKNLARYITVPNSVFIVSPCLQIYNALRFTELFAFFNPYRPGRGRLHYLPQVVRDPQFLHVSLLPRGLRLQCKNKILDFIKETELYPAEADSFKAIASEFDIENPKSFELREKFVKFTKVLDRSRGQNCLELMPELTSLFQEENTKPFSIVE